MKNYSFTGFVLLLLMTLTGCTNEDLSTEFMEGADVDLNEVPSALKANAEAAGAPLFDLATAPNGDILVADASAGITDIHGSLETALAGVTSVAPVGSGNMWATTGPSGDPEMNTGQALYRVNKHRTSLVADLFAFEEAHDPDGTGVDSNPYSVTALNSSEALVADAGANDLLRVDNQGNIEVVAVFPVEPVSTQNIKELLGCPGSGADLCNLGDMMPAQPVPTSVVIGPDGYYYVGELKGFPAPAGESNIWKISPNASGAMCGSSPDCVKVFDGGFTSIIDMTFDKNGILYVAELDEQSWFAVEVLHAGIGGTISACDPETLECEVIASGIPMLTSITFDKDGKLWATKNALVPGLAEVVEIQL